MDSITIQKIQAMKKSKKHQLLDKFFPYSLTAVTCSLFCSSPFWFPSLCSVMKFFLLVSLPKIGSVFLGTKFLFVIGNLIVLALIAESKFFASESFPSSDVYYQEYVNKSQGLRTPSISAGKSVMKTETSLQETVKGMTSEDGKNMKGTESEEDQRIELEKEREDLDGEDHGYTLPNEELTKRADDLIARVNKQRRLEARLLLCGS